MKTIVYLMYTTQLNSNFHVRWLASSGVISQVLLTSEKPNKGTLWSANNSACMVYTKTIIHLSVDESSASRLDKSVHLHVGE